MSRAPRTLRLALAAALVLLAVLGGWLLVSDVRTRFAELATAQSDNLQWTLSQVEVEYLALESALLRAELGADRGLDAVRRRFNILYSRVGTLQNSGLFAELRAEPDFRAGLVELRAALDASIPLIDGSDAALDAGLETLETRFAELRAPVRALGLAGITHFAAQSDARREGFLATLSRVAGLAVALILALAGLVVVLWRAIRISKAHASDAQVSAARMSAVVSSSLDAVIVADVSGRVIEANAAVQEVFGYAPVELLGRPMSETIVPAHLAAAHEAGMARHARTGERRVIGRGRVQMEGRRKDGSLFPVELSVSEATSAEGRVYVSFLRDISRRVAAERELRAARDAAQADERAKARMLATMSHEMRTPLNGLMGTLELMEDTGLDAEQRRLLTVMRGSGEVLLHHIDDVLDVTRLDAGRLELRRVPFALNPLLEGLVAGQRPHAERGGTTLALAPLPGPDGVEGDPARLRQILLNLVGNAIKFTERGTISVEAERIGAGETVEFRVLDTGIGIPPDQIGTIFEDFVTLDSSYGRVQGGTGLGLGIVRRMVHALGGELGAESEPGEGSLFWVRLPLPAAEVPAEADGPGDGRALRRRDAAAPRDILVVEDNEVNRQILRQMLERLGHRVREAADGEAGVAEAAARCPDLILMDISMPRMDGISATRAIRSGDGPARDVPVVALTAHAMPEEIARFEAAGIARTIVKPVTRGALAAVIDALDGSGEETARPAPSASLPSGLAGTGSAQAQHGAAPPAAPPEPSPVPRTAQAAQGDPVPEDGAPEPTLRAQGPSADPTPSPAGEEVRLCGGAPAADRALAAAPGRAEDGSAPPAGCPPPPSEDAAGAGTQRQCTQPPGPARPDAPTGAGAGPGDRDGAPMQGLAACPADPGDRPPQMQAPDRDGRALAPSPAADAPAARLRGAEAAPPGMEFGPGASGARPPSADAPAGASQGAGGCTHAPGGDEPPEPPARGAPGAGSAPPAPASAGGPDPGARPGHPVGAPRGMASTGPARAAPARHPPEDAPSDAPPRASAQGAAARASGHAPASGAAADRPGGAVPALADPAVATGAPAATAPHPMAHEDDAPPPAVDMAGLAELEQGLGEAALPAVLGGFVAQADAAVARLAGPDGQRMPQGDLVSHAHRLAGAAAMFGAGALRSRLTQIEALAKAGRITQARAALPALADLWAEARPVYARRLALSEAAEAGSAPPEGR